MTDPTRSAVAAAWRAECGRIVGALMRLTHGDLGLAEECAQDALVAALEHWPAEGLPDNPGAWLMQAAKHRALDHLRHRTLAERKHDELGRDLEAAQAVVVPDFSDSLDARRADTVGDDQLRLMFIACHPVLSPDARVALTLRLLGGLATDEIARAFLVPETTVAQRIVRAKKTLADAQVPFELPQGAALAERLASVLEVVYLVFNEGYSPTSGSDWVRPALVDEALRLGRLLLRLAPAEPEAAGLLALMALQASRIPARVDGEGRPVLLPDQDRSRWDTTLRDEGLAALARAEAGAGGAPGPYVIQAAIAACHARAARAEDTDWRRIAALYATLAERQPTPVVQLNRAVAIGMAEGPAAGLALADGLQAEPRLAQYPWLHSVRGDLLQRLGRRDEARAAFLRAAELTRNDSDRALLLARATA